MSNISSPPPKRGEVWMVNFDPTLGSEINKVRPAVVVSSDSVGKLPVKLIAPLTDWKDRYSGNLWHIRIDPGHGNGLSKSSAVDALQVRGADVLRFQRKLGRLSSREMENIAAAIAAVVEYQ